MSYKVRPDDIKPSHNSPPTAARRINTGVGQSSLRGVAQYGTGVAQTSVQTPKNVQHVVLLYKVQPRLNETHMADDPRLEAHAPNAGNNPVFCGD